MKLQLLAFLVYAISSMVCQQVWSRSAEDLLIELANASNNAISRPINKTTVVTVNIYFRQVEEINENKQEIKLQMTFRQEWHDSRLKFDSNKRYYVNINPDKDVIWRPDTFFQNAREVRDLHQPNRHINHMIRIYSDGNVLDSQRLFLRLWSQMKTSDYPFGGLECLLDLASYAYTTANIKYDWKQTHPIQLKSGLTQQLIGYKMDNVQTDYCTSKTNTGEYSCLRLRLLLSREPWQVLVRLHLPSCLLVVLSWISLWLERRSPSATLALLLDLLLIIAFLIQIQTVYPSVPVGATAVETWVAMVLVFLVLATLEVGVVLVLDGWEKGQSLSTKIDFFARILFPVAFAIFIIIYFIYCLA